MSDRNLSLFTHPFLLKPMSKESKSKKSPQRNYLLLAAEIITITLIISAFIAPIFASSTQTQSSETKIDEG